VHFEDGGGTFEIASLGLAALGLDVARFRRSGTLGYLRYVELNGGLGSARISGALKHLGFERRDAVDPPGSVYELLDKLLFGGTLRLILAERTP
jgi:hypothetical protein